MGQLLAAAHSAPQSSSAAPPPFTSPAEPPVSGLPAILNALASVPLAVAILLACLVLLGVGAGYRLLYIRRHPRAFSPMAEAEAQDMTPTPV